MDDLVERNDLYYKKYYNEPFTGEESGLANEGRILKARLKRIENLLIDAGLMPED